MTERVIDHFEVIDIDDQERNGSAGYPTRVKHLRGRLPEGATHGHAGQVVQRFVSDGRGARPRSIDAMSDRHRHGTDRLLHRRGILHQVGRLRGPIDGDLFKPRKDSRVEHRADVLPQNRHRIVVRMRPLVAAH